MSKGRGAAIRILENRIQEWPDELKLLVSCLRMGLPLESNGPQGPVALLQPIDRLIDWEKFLHLAGRHRVVPWVNKASERLRESGAPEEVLKRLAHATHENTARMMRLMGELIRILDLFKSAGIAALRQRNNFSVISGRLWDRILLFLTWDGVRAKPERRPRKHRRSSLGSERGTPCGGGVPHNKLDRSSCVFSAINRSHCGPVEIGEFVYK